MSKPFGLRVYIRISFILRSNIQVMVSKMMLFVIVETHNISFITTMTYPTQNIIFVQPARESFGFKNVLRKNGTMCIWMIYTTTPSYAGMQIRRINCCMVWLGHMDDVFRSKLFSNKLRAIKIVRSDRRSKSDGDEG